MVRVTDVNHCKPRYCGAAEKTSFVLCCIQSVTAVVKNDKGYGYQARGPMIRSHFLTFLKDNSLGVKMDANPFSIKSETW